MINDVKELDPITSAMAAAQLFGLSGKTILVTGASKGLGQIASRFFAASGAKLIITGRDEQRLNETFKSLAGEGHRAIIADLSDMRALESFATECGAVDGVVHCAGIRGLSPMKMVSDSFLTEVMTTNYLSPIMLTRHLLAKQLIRSGGSIVLLSSLAALSGTVGVGPYAGSKAALIGVMRPLALELARRKIRINALCPALVETPLTTLDRPWFDEISKRYPLGVGQPEDVAQACLYFLSDASRVVTGTVFAMDGGLEYA